MRSGVYVYSRHTYSARMQVPYSWLEACGLRCGTQLGSLMEARLLRPQLEQLGTPMQDWFQLTVAGRCYALQHVCS